MASFASSATTGGARKHAWTKIFKPSVENKIIFIIYFTFEAPFNLLISGDTPPSLIVHIITKIDWRVGIF